MSAFDARIAAALGWTPDEAHSFAVEITTRSAVNHEGLPVYIASAPGAPDLLARATEADAQRDGADYYRRTRCPHGAFTQADYRCPPECAVPVDTGAVRVTPSTVKPENVEIRFAVKPDADVRAELKAAGFRWMARDACWYGPRVSLPARFGDAS